MPPSFSAVVRVRLEEGCIHFQRSKQVGAALPADGWRPAYARPEYTLFTRLATSLDSWAHFSPDGQRPPINRNSPGPRDSDTPGFGFLDRINIPASCDDPVDVLDVQQQTTGSRQGGREAGGQGDRQQVHQITTAYAVQSWPPSPERVCFASGKGSEHASPPLSAGRRRAKLHPPTAGSG